MAVPPDFVAGQVLTAAQMNKIGLWLVKSQTIGTAVSTVTVTDAFSADYENYRIVIAGGTASAANNILMTLGATATGYYFAGIGQQWDTNTTVASVGANSTSWLVGFGRTAGLSCSMDLFRPQLADETSFVGQAAAMATDGRSLSPCGYLANTTQYTAFTITTSTGTWTGGTISVYGWRD